MKKDDIITLPTGENVKVVNADLTKYKNVIVVERENQERRVIGRDDLTFAHASHMSTF